MIPDRLPWHDRQWRRVERDIRATRVPHALLLRGAAGCGKALFAARLAAALLCRSDDPPCGECGSCRLCAAGSHPDRIDVAIEKDRREIVIDQVRGLIHTVGLTARIGPCKVVIVNPAEQMNRHAANTLLKTLEEPPGATVFLLVSANHALLLATVRSRCQLIDFPTADLGIALEWLRGRVPDPAAALALAPGAPIRAVELSEGGLIEIALRNRTRSRRSPRGRRSHGRRRTLEGTRARNGLAVARGRPRGTIARECPRRCGRRPAGYCANPFLAPSAHARPLPGSAGRRAGTPRT